MKDNEFRLSLAKLKEMQENEEVFYTINSDMGNLCNRLDKIFR